MIEQRSMPVGPLAQRLRPDPARGATLAGGAVALGLAAVVIDLRMTQWAVGPRFVVIGAIAALIVTIAWLAPLEAEVPAPYHSALLVTGLLVSIIALQLLAEALGAHHPPGAGGDFWTFVLEAALAWVMARRANSAACTLIAALAAVVALEALISWIFNPHGLGTFRAFLVVGAVALAGAAYRIRPLRPRHAVALVNAAGVATLVLALTFVLTTIVSLAVSRFGAGTPYGTAGSASFLWKLYILLAGLALIGYAAVDRAPGPAYLGVGVLFLFATLVGLHLGGQGSLVGWPLFLLIVGAAAVLYALRRVAVGPGGGVGPVAPATPAAGPPPPTPAAEAAAAAQAAAAAEEPTRTDLRPARPPDDEDDPTARMPWLEDE